MNKILLFTDSYIEGHGGVASYAHDFVDAYCKDYEIVVITGDTYSCENNKMSQEKKIYNISSTDISENSIKKVLHIIADERPQIVINSFFPPLSLAAPFINDDIRLINVSHFVDWKLMWIAGINGSYADKIVTLSEKGSRNINEIFLGKNDSDKCTVIYNYIPSANSSITIEEKKQIPRLKLVFPGGCSYAKSAEIVALTLKKLLKTNLDFEFYWTGNTKVPGANWPLVKTKRIENTVDGSDPRIKQFGPVSRKENQKILSECNVFILPSRGEGCPITLLESIRHGCIVIVSDAEHGSLDIVKDGKFGCIVKQGSAKALFNKITEIIKHHDQFIDEYDRSIAYFNTNLSFSHWKKSMDAVLTGPNSHRPRINEFDHKTFKNSHSRLNRLFKRAWFEDRMRQLYHFMYFRYIRYIAR